MRASDIKPRRDSEIIIDLLGEFLPHAQKELGLDDLPNIEVVNDLHGTFGNFSQDGIRIVAKGRHPVDVLRTLAHELVHYKQMVNDELDDAAGEDGSPQENEANSKAAVIMRKFNRDHPDLLR
jgi:hypothetical protein